MKFTDIFIRRPVLASVVSLLILLIGLRSIDSLQVRQYPEMKSTVVTVTTAYPGADSDLVKSFITTPLQQAIAEADGIDYMTSTSTQGTSTIEAHMVLNYDPNAAVSEIQAKVASKRNVLPTAAEDPVIDSTTGDRTALMYLAFYSDTMASSQITDYLLRVVQPKLQALPGVAKAQIIGNKTFAMRVWLDPKRMAALHVTADDVTQVLLANNYQAGIGQTKGSYVAIDLSANTDISDTEDFRNLVVKSTGDTLVRIRDIADTELGAEDYNSMNWYKGKTAIFIGISQAPSANPLDVAQRVHDALPGIRSQLPEAMRVELPYDASEFIEDSIHEVFRTIAEAVLIVLGVIFLTLGSLRAAAIPAVAVPLSLIGAAFVMLLLGFSINLLTLLAMVLAIGLVVDDAIIVVENIHRHIENGESKFNAAIKGARELGLPIIAMTTTLVAVYAPIGFMRGLVGSLFTEFAFALAGAVLISGVVALTLSPMLSSKVLKTQGAAGRFETAVEHAFAGLARRYEQLLQASLNYIPVTVVFAALVLASIYLMFVTSQKELAPTEDQSILFFQASAPQTATIDYDLAYVKQIEDAFESIPEFKESFFLIGAGGSPANSFGGFKMPFPDQRKRSQMVIQPELQQKLAKVAGLQIAVFPRPSIPGARGGLPVEFVITSPGDYARMDNVADAMIGRAMQSGKFIFLSKSIDFTRPRTAIVVDRDRAADLGITMQDIGRNLSNMLGGGYINWFNLEGRSYKVIPQVGRQFRLDQKMLDNYYIRSASGGMIPMSTLITFKKSVEPSSRTQFQQLNSVTLQGMSFPNVTLGDALDYLKQAAKDIFPSGFSYDFLDESRQYEQQGSALILTFFMSILVIYLVLAAQFESWRDPLIIMVSVPMSIAGAMAFITLGLASVNIYTQVGLITLIGLIAKNGILIVQFANQLQMEEGLDKRRAVAKAAAIRLRPILMTTISMIMAMVPLLTASGPGGVSRFDIGLVIATGLGIGTLFTLFVVPAVYMLLARTHQAAETAA
jgi:multidrug efflux pump